MGTHMDFHITTHRHHTYTSDHTKFFKMLRQEKVLEKKSQEEEVTSRSHRDPKTVVSRSNVLTSRCSDYLLGGREQLVPVPELPPRNICCLVT